MFIVFLRTNFDDVYRDSFFYHYNQINVQSINVSTLEMLKTTNKGVASTATYSAKGGWMKIRLCV